MPIPLIDRKTGQLYDAADETEARAQMRQYGLELASPEETKSYDEAPPPAAPTSFGDQLRTGLESAGAAGANIISGLSKLPFNPRAIVDPFEFNPETQQYEERKLFPLSVEGSDVAPALFSDEAKARRKANPKAAFVGAVAPDLAAMAILPGPAKGEAAADIGANFIGRSLAAGVTSEASTAALEDRPVTLDGIAQGGLVAGMLEGAGEYAIHQAMRALGKTGRTAVDASVEGAQRAAVADLEGEADPVLLLQKRIDHGQPAVAEYQTQLDQALDTIDERLTSAPEKMFTPRMLRSTVANNPEAQADAVAKLATQFAHVADVTDHAASKEASAVLANAVDGAPSDLYGALREAWGTLEKDADGTAIFGDGHASPLFAEARAELEESLGNVDLWGQAAKNHTEYAGFAPGEPVDFRIDDLGQREALDARLDLARRAASTNGDKRLAAAVTQAREALGKTDAVLGAQLLGPEGAAPQSLLERLKSEALGAAEDKVHAVAGNAAAGAGAALGHAVAGPVGAAAGAVGGRQLYNQLGKKWTSRIWSWAKDAAKRNPTKIAGAGLLGASALTDDQHEGEGLLAANAGLLVFFLPSGGRARLAGELGEALGGLTSRERFNLRVATERSAADAEHLLRRYVAGDRTMTHEAFGPEQFTSGPQPAMRVDSTHPMNSPQELLDGQFTIALDRYARQAGIPVEKIPDAVHNALLIELRARNAALIENDAELLRLAKPGRLDLLPRPAEHYDGPSEQWPGSPALMKAEGALQPGDMPTPAARHLDRIDVRLSDRMSNIDATNQAAVQEAAYHALGEFQRDFRAEVGREPNARETAFAEAQLVRTSERRAGSARRQGAGPLRDMMAAIPGGPEAVANQAPPPGMSESARNHFTAVRNRMRESVDAARRGDVPSRNQLDQNPRHYYERWLNDSVVRGGSFDARSKAWAERQLVDPVYEYLGRKPTVGEGLPAASRQLAGQFGDRVRAGDRQSAAAFLESWEHATESSLGRDLTPEELAWGREQIVEARPNLRAVSGEGQGARGADAEFRRVGLPEPTQGEVRIETPMQQKEFPFVRELERSPRIEGEPMRSPGDPTLQRRVAELEERVQKRPDLEQAFPVEAQTRFRSLERDIRRFGNYRTRSDAELATTAANHAESVSYNHARTAGQPLPPDVQELMRARLEREMRAVRAEQVRENPLNAEERAQVAYETMQEGDLPEKLQGYLGEVRSQVRDAITHASQPEEIQRAIRRGLEEMHDRFVVASNRPPNARERAYMEADLAHEAGQRFERETNVEQQRVRSERKREALAERQRQERIQRKQREAREAQRVDELMGSLDHFEANDDEAHRLMREYETTRQQLIDKGASGDALSREAVFGAMEARRGKALTDGEQVFLHDQTDAPAPAALDWLHEATDDLARHDESHFSDGVPSLEFDDVLEQVERERGKLDPWEEYHVRQAWEENQRTLERSFENQIENVHAEQKAEYEAEREREKEQEDFYSRRSSYDEADGLPDASDLRRAGLDSIDVNDPRGIYEVFGQDLSLHDAEELFALGPLNELGATTRLKVNRHDVKFEARGGGVTMDRTYTQGDDGLEVHHDQFFLTGSQQGAGTMKKIFRAMFPAYERLGFVKAIVSCAQVGKYLWPKLGFKASEEVEQMAIDKFLESWLLNGLPGEAVERLRGELGTLRDVADASVPVHLVEHDLPEFEAEYRRSVGGDFKKFFIEDGDFKVGKLFLMTQTGPWNSGLVLDINRNSDWYREFLSRIGLMSASGLGLAELMKAFEQDNHLLQNDNDLARAGSAPAQAETSPSAEERNAKAATQAKLKFLETQSAQLTRSTARALVTPAQQARTISITPGVTQSSGIKSFAGDNQSLRAAYDDKRQLLERIQRDPMSLVDEMTHQLADVSDANPALHQQIVGKTYEILRFLQGKMPATIGTSLVRPEGTPPSEFALRQFALYYSAATNPSTVLVDLGNNRARKEQVDTLRELWPAVYQKTKLQLLSQLADATTKTRPSFNQRARLDLLFDFGPALDGAFSNRITTIAQNAQPDAGKPSAPGAGPGAGPGAQMPERKTQPSIAGSSALSPLYKGAAGPGAIAAA